MIVKPVMSADQRRDHHLAEFKRACEELDPMIGSWSAWIDDDDLSQRLVAHRVTGRYEGDGIYESGRVNARGNRGEWTVSLTPDQIDGYRTFLVACPGERMRLTEPCLETFIGRKLAA